MIGLKPAYIAFHPFGVNLRLKNKIVGSLSDEIILYFSGPLVNIIFALVCLLIYKQNNNIYVYDFYIKNIALFFINMLPIVPLDGGVILKKIIMYRIGYKAAQRLMLVISCIFTGVLCVMGIYLIYINNTNFSVILLTAFMIGNIFTQKEKYNIDFIREVIFYNDKKKQRVKIYAAESEESLSDISLNFNMQNFYIVFFMDKHGKINRIMTETEILNRVIAQK